MRVCMCAGHVHDFSFMQNTGLTRECGDSLVQSEISVLFRNTEIYHYSVQQYVRIYAVIHDDTHEMKSVCEQ